MNVEYTPVNENIKIKRQRFTDPSWLSGTLTDVPAVPPLIGPDYEM
jgi:hypothetical protein